ncbi:AAA family ATPase [Streptomyces sp. PRKS01-65]|nr:AAA family ATPase [Streptomyces harenosi]NEY32381.1 AAA family ATPase [Streptomyces harenosi]
MPLERFSLENYRCFKDRQEVELGKITVVLGRNNAGKSAVVRALPLLSTGIRTDSPYPLDLDPIQGFAPSFTDLIHGSSPHGRIRVGLSFRTADDRTLGVDAQIQNIADQGTQLVSELEISCGSEREKFSWVPGPDAYSVEKRTYRVGGKEKQLSFRGILPAASDWSDSVGGVDDVAGKILKELDEVRYLGPFRKGPDRFFRASARPSGSVGSRGEKALGMLAADEMRGRGRVTHEVNRLLADMLPGWRIAVTDVGAGMYVPRLHSTRDPDLFVHIDDVGTGVVQFLPILIQRAADKVDPPAHPVIEIVEEPELHLHPSAHASLADLYIEAARETNVRFLVETHSENFLLRLRRRVAEQRLRSEDLSVYFVEQGDGYAYLRRIGVDPLGNIDYWPRGIFAEDFEEARALADAQANRFDDAR